MRRTHGSDRDDSIGPDGPDGSAGTGRPGAAEHGTLSGPAVLAGIGGGDVSYEPRRIAIVGLACRFADADDPASLLDLITTGRRAFRRIPPCRVDLADYYSATPGTPDATYSTRAALIEGWRFDRAAFGVSPAAYASADPAHWLALETAARALAAAGFPGGLGLPAQRTAAFIGNTLAGDVSRATSLRLRWPYTRRVIADALFSSGVPADLAGRVLRTAAARYLAPFPQVTADTLAGSTPGTIATRIGAHLGLRGGGMAVDAGGASALAAVASACLALSSGDIDAAVAGGVDLSLDPLDLVGLAKSGMLATGAMRIYDEHPTGFLPGEGAGMVLLMRSADARAARLPVYAEIVGWGAASAGRPEIADQSRPAAPEAAGLLLGLHQAFSMARIDPADVGLIEGSGTGVAAIDEAELAALAALRSGATETAAFGAISANLGHTRAAAGAASLIKAVLAIANGVLPPTTGVGVPHPMLRDGRAALRLPSVPEPWPGRARHASVSALGSDGLGVHLVLRQPSGGSGPAAGGPSRRLVRGTRIRRQPGIPGPAAEQPVPAPGGSLPAVLPAAAGYSMDAQHPAAFLFQAPDRLALTSVLSRIADVAPWLSDAELGDLAIQLSSTATAEPAARVAIIAARQEQLARRASEAITLLPRLTGGLLKSAPGIIAADAADGRVTLLLSGRRASSADLPQRELARLMSILRWLDELGVRADAVVGHGVGELAGLVWAGCTTPADARALNSIRASVLAAPDDSAPGQLSDAIDRFARFEFRPPRRRLISGCTGTELAGADQVPEMLSAEVFDSRLGGGRLAEAVRAGAVGATLLLQTSQDPDLREAVGQVGKVPAVAIDGDPADSVAVTRAIAALFAAGAIGAPAAIAAGRPARPIDIWREQVFITNPCQIPLGPTGQQAGQDRVPAGQSDDDQPGTDRADQPAAGPDTADRAAATGADQATGLATLASLATRTGPASLTGTVEEPGAGQPPSPVPVASVTPWARCYVEQLRQPGRPVPAADQGAWRIYSGGCESLRPAIETAFRRDPAARRTLAVLGPLDAAGTSEAALRAAQDAIESGILVAICAGPDLTGLWASLHAEHPSLGITVIRAPMTSDGIAAAAGVAAAWAGEYRELAVDASGAVREPVMAPVAAPGDGSFPLGPEDVVLVSRAAGAAGLALAQVIACSGAAIAIIGGRQARQDEEVIATLEQLRQAGARVSYEAVDTADRTGMLAAIRRIEGRLGPITAVGHAVAGTPRLPVADLTAADLDRLIRAQTLVLDQIVSAIRAAGRPAARTTARTAHGRAASQGGGGLRLIATFGSVVGRYGLAGESVLAVASQALAEHGERLAVAGPGCAALHIDWPGWAQDGLGERADLSDALRRAGFA
nr:beta-ketoacyl synthase N-terminal-like domain-containing protein [Actinomycetota bacterium]